MSTDNPIKFNGLEITQPVAHNSTDPEPVRFVETQQVEIAGIPFVVERINRRHLILKPAKNVGYACANGVMQIHRK
jgi:hypothetical protein